MAAKTKIKDSLKNTLINELKDKKETERLERVKENSKLPEVTIYTTPRDKSYLDFLELEGIKFKNVDITGNPIEWKKTTALTNFGITPTVVVNDVFILARQRDFQNQQQLIQGIQYLSDPRNQAPTDLNKVLEHAKTNNYHLFQRINHLENAFKPLINFITTLQKQIEEDEKSE